MANPLTGTLLGTPPALTPGTATPPNPLPGPHILPLPSEGHGSRQYWKQQIDAAIERVTKEKPDWDANILSYRAKSLNAIPTTDTVVVPRDFTFVEQKSAQLFFQTPEVHLKTNLRQLADAVTVFQPVLNYYLSEDRTNALGMMNEVIFDALCPAGLMCSQIGYECFFDRIDSLPTGAQIANPDYVQPEAQPSMPQPGGMPGMPGIPAEALDSLIGGQGQGPPPPVPGAGDQGGMPPGMPPMPPLPAMVDQMMPVPNIVYERYYIERFSPAKVLIPLGFSGSVYDKAPWLGMRFEDDWEILRRRFQIPDSIPQPRSKATNSEDLELKGEKPTTTTRSSQTKCQGVILWYRTYLFDPACAHPEKLRQLVLLDGVDEPIIHRDSPYQRMSKDKRLLLGMIGFPIHIGALRYVSDSAFPPSECSISRATNEELNKSRTQMMLQRDRSIPMRIASLSRMGGEKGMEKVRQNIYQSIIGLPDFDPDKPPISAVGLAHYPQENFTFSSILDADLGQIWAMGANQRGQESENSLTATEVSKIDQWANTRLDKERRQALTYYIRATRKLGGLLQLFLSDAQIMDVVGQDKMQRIQSWDRKQVPGEFAYTANPDSAIRIDQAQARTQILKLYELLAKDPYVKRYELLTEVCRQWNLDPATLLVTQLPPKGPDPASVTIALKPEFIDTTNPNFPMILALLKAAGFTILEDPIKNQETGQMEPSPVEQAMELHKFHQQVGTMAETGVPPTGPESGGPMVSPPARQPEHPGAAPHADHLSKHHADDGGEGNPRGPVTGFAKPH